MENVKPRRKHLKLNRIQKTPFKFLHAIGVGAETKSASTVTKCYISIENHNFLPG